MNKEWPDETRIDIIGQNGPTGEHYQKFDKYRTKKKQKDDSIKPVDYHYEKDGRWWIKDVSVFYNDFLGYIHDRVKASGYKNQDDRDDVVGDVLCELVKIGNQGSNNPYSHIHYIQLAMRTVISLKRSKHRKVDCMETPLVDWEHLEQKSPEDLSKYLIWMLENAKMEDTKTTLNKMMDGYKGISYDLALIKGVSRQAIEGRDKDNELKGKYTYKDELHDLLREAIGVYGQ